MLTRWMVRLMTMTVGVCLMMPVGALAQTPKASDLKAEVPALTAMHEVIMPMWHEAWPKKDTAALAGLAGKLDKYMSAIAKADLPGVLRDKAGAWQDGVAQLKTTVAAYKAAAAAKDDDALLKAAESLHTDYEALVKVVRPILKEMEDFHSSLYVLYHYQLNPLDLAAAGESAAALQTKMVALNAATLPERHKAKQDAFTAQRARLSKAVDAVVATMTTKDEARIKESIELMHLEYEKLERIFS